MSARALVVAAFTPVLMLAACSTDQTIVVPDPHLNRMLKQRKAKAYDETPVFPHGMVMRNPPDGTIPTDAVLGPPLLALGFDEHSYAERVPIPLTPHLLATGRTRFETYCAACHGVAGDGNSAVAAKMTLRKPPSLYDADGLVRSPGATYQVITAGYGLMPGYDVQLSVEERWAVVAYVEALKLSRYAQVSTLPPDVRTELEKEPP